MPAHTPPDSSSRAHARTPLSLHGTFAVDDGGEMACMVMDISPGGALLMASDLPDEGSELRLNITGLGRLRAEVVRTTGMEFAVRFTVCEREQKRIASSIAWQFNRIRLNLPDNALTSEIDAERQDPVMLEDGTALDACISEVSLTGVAYISTQRPDIGTHVRVGAMTGRIARHFETGFAVAFDPPGSELDAAA